MQVKVRAFGDLAKALGRETTLNLPSGATVGDLLSKLGERSKTLTRKVSSGGGLGRNLVVLVGGLNIQFLDKYRTRLNEGDVVSLLPPAGGG